MTLGSRRRKGRGKEGREEGKGGGEREGQAVKRDLGAGLCSSLSTRASQAMTPGESCVEVNGAHCHTLLLGVKGPHIWGGDSPPLPPPHARQSYF